MRKNKIILLMLLFIGINLVLIENVDASTSKSTYTIVYNSNGGNGKQVTQQCKRNKYVNLIGNTYKKEGYVFSGWTVNKNGTGKMYKNKARVKNLTSGNKIILYAKWTDKKIKDMTPVLQAVIEGNYRDNGWKYKFDNESLWGSIYDFAFHFCHTKIPGMKFKRIGYMEYAILDEKLVENVCSAMSVEFNKIPEIEKDYSHNIKYDKKGKKYTVNVTSDCSMSYDMISYTKNKDGSVIVKVGEYFDKKYDSIYVFKLVPNKNKNKLYYYSVESCKRL